MRDYTKEEEFDRALSERNCFRCHKHYGACTVCDMAETNALFSDLLNTDRGGFAESTKILGSTPNNP